MPDWAGGGADSGDDPERSDTDGTPGAATEHADEHADVQPAAEGAPDRGITDPTEISG